MSETCLVNLKDFKCGFEELNNLSKQIVKYAVDHDLAVFFCSDYMHDFTVKAGMKSYFFMSDSFLYENCEFLSLDYDSCREINTIEKFYERFHFFGDIVEILQKNKVQKIEIYISEDALSDVDRFDEIASTSKSIVKDLYDVIILNNEDSCFFRSTKFIIENQITA